MNFRFEEKMTATGFQAQTPIQEAVAEPLAEGKSINALAPTGTGKTLAFTWPLLDQLTPEDGEQLLILSPSQELAMQTTRVVREWAKELDLRVLSLTGGANVKNQLDRLKKHPEILIGTPGRVAELATKGKLKMKRLRTLVLDEADDLLREETAEQIELIWSLINDDSVQVALFGATAVDEQVPTELFDRPFDLIDVRDVPMPTKIKHEFWMTANDQRNKRLRQLASQRHMQAIVFFNTTKQLKMTATFLAHEHIGMATLVRGDSSSTREKAMRSFRNGDAKFLLTTDVGARGLDIPDLPAVINFDMPRMGETYTHRAGRTGRMNKAGTVITFGNDHDLRDLKRLVGVEIEAVSGRPSLLADKQGLKPMGNKKVRPPKYDSNGKRLPKDPKPAVTTTPELEPEVTSGATPFDANKKAAKSKKRPLDDSAKSGNGDGISRKERFEREKKAKRKNRKDKGKPKPRQKAQD